MILLRRRLLAAGLALPFADALAQSCTRTPSQTEGPFFKTDTPLRASFLEKDSPGRLVVSGQVLSARCQPVPNALLEFWHADEFGEYDNKGYRYRGHQQPTRRDATAWRRSCPRSIRDARATSTRKCRRRGGASLRARCIFPASRATPATVSIAASWK